MNARARAVVRRLRRRRQVFLRARLHRNPRAWADEPFVWGVWVSLSEASFSQYLDSYDEPRRAHLGPFFGWLSASFKVYPETEGSLKTHVHLRDDGVRPYIELEHTDHPLAREQRQGIDAARLAQIYAAYMHA